MNLSTYFSLFFYCSRLITRRSLVQVQPPQPLKSTDSVRISAFSLLFRGLHLFFAPARPASVLYLFFMQANPKADIQPRLVYIGLIFLLLCRAGAAGLAGFPLPLHRLTVSHGRKFCPSLSRWHDRAAPPRSVNSSLPRSAG